MSRYTELRTKVIGATLDPPSAETRRNIAFMLDYALTIAIFVTSKLIFERENWLIRLLHNQAALAIQRRLHLHGMQMVILPMKI